MLTSLVSQTGSKFKFLSSNYRFQIIIYIKFTLNIKYMKGTSIKYLI